MNDSIDFAMRFSNYHIHDLLKMANSSYELSFFDREDLYSLIEELSDRLEGYYTNDMMLASNATA